MNLPFAATGTVDGGAGGVNSLVLQNTLGIGGGTSGSGTWTLQGPLVSGAATLNGGLAQFNNSSAFGSGVLTANGGILQASTGGLTLSNLISTASVSVGGLNNLDAVAALSADQARVAYDSLSGEIHASTRSALFDDSRYVRDVIGTRLRSADGQAPAEGVLHVDADSGMTFWVQGYGSWGDNDGNGNVGDLDHNSQGALMGVDIPLNDIWRVGVAAGYGKTDLDLDARNASAKIDSTSLTAYVGGQWDALHLRAGASYAWSDIDSSRHVQVGNLQEHAKGSYDASTRQVFAELGYTIQAGNLILEPFAGMAHVEVDTDSLGLRGATPRRPASRSSLPDAHPAALLLCHSNPSSAPCVVCSEPGVTPLVHACNKTVIYPDACDE